jgi:hypothetical protein
VTDRAAVRRPHHARGVCSPVRPLETCPVTRDELTRSLSFALRFNGRKRLHDADEIMARITAERLVEHLERSGYVVMHGTVQRLEGSCHPGKHRIWICERLKSVAGP